MAKDYDKCYELIRLVNKKLKAHKNIYEFVFRDWHIGRWVKNTRCYTTQNSSRDEIMKFYNEIDYMLLPYDKKRYVISSSGVFFDSLAAAIPIITLNSRCITQYENENIYIGADNIQNLAKTVIDLIENFDRVEYDLLRKRIVDVRSKFNNENVERLKQWKI